MTASGTVLHQRARKDRPEPVVRTAIRRNAAGHKLGTVDLEPSLFGLTPNRAVLHQVVTAQLAGARAGTQSTKTRAEVRGGGAKPFRQKGTGRARQGSSRSPSMAGGGVALGPKPRSYAQRTPKKMVRLALLSALSDRAEIGRICVIDDWKIEEPSTRDAAILVRKLRLDATVLVVLAGDELDVERSFANLRYVQTTTFAQLSAHHVLRADWLLFSDRSLPTLSSGGAEADDDADDDVDADADDEETPTPEPQVGPVAEAEDEETASVSDAVETDGATETEAVEADSASEEADADA